MCGINGFTFKDVSLIRKFSEFDMEYHEFSNFFETEQFLDIYLIFYS